MCDWFVSLASSDTTGSSSSAPFPVSPGRGEVRSSSWAQKSGGEGGGREWAEQTESKAVLCGDEGGVSREPALEGDGGGDEGRDGGKAVGGGEAGGGGPRCSRRTPADTKPLVTCFIHHSEQPAFILKGFSQDTYVMILTSLNY